MQYCVRFALISIFFLCQVAYADVTNGIVGWWKMDDASTTATDSSSIFGATAHNGTYVNGASAVSSPSKFGKAGSFTGTSSQYIDLGGNFNYTTQNFSIAFWVYLTKLTTDGASSAGQSPVLFFKGQYSTNGYYAQVVSDNSVFFATSQSGAGQISQTPASMISTNTWIHLVFVRNGASVRIYVNGVDKTSIVGTHINPDSAPENFKIMAYSLNYPIYSSGYVDDFRIYNRALSAAEAREIYGSSSTLFGSVD